MNNSTPNLWQGRNDFYFLLLLFIISFLSWGYHNFFSNKTAGGYVVKVFVPEYKEYHFDSPPKEPLVLKGKIGISTIEWDSDGRYRFVQSACPSQVCVNTGWSSVHPIICLPNAIIVEKLGSYNDKYDAFTR